MKEKAEVVFEHRIVVLPDNSKDLLKDVFLKIGTRIIPIATAGYTREVQEEYEKSTKLALNLALAWNTLKDDLEKNVQHQTKKKEAAANPRS